MRDTEIVLWRTHKLVPKFETHKFNHYSQIAKALAPRIVQIVQIVGFSHPDGPLNPLRGRMVR